MHKLTRHQIIAALYKIIIEADFKNELSEDCRCCSECGATDKERCGCWCPNCRRLVDTCICEATEEEEKEKEKEKKD